MAVKVFKPAVTVKLIKMVKRSGEGVAERYSSAAREVDLTPHLSEGGGIKIVKSVREPAGGFVVTLADQVDLGTKDSLYARTEPMDVIEIRGSREPHRYAGQKLPLIMRGFVSSVRRTETVNSNGDVQRFVVIQGQDSGKLWLIHRLFWEAIYANAANAYLDVFRLQAATGIDIAYLPVAEAMRQLTTRIINDKVRKMAAYADQQQVLKPFTTSRITVPEGMVSINLIAPFQGPYWGLARLIADEPWNELFIEDEEEAPAVVFRPAPFKDIRGQFIMPGAADPGTIEIDISQVVSLDLVRSDERVANFFYVPPGASSLEAPGQVTVAAIAGGTPFDVNYGNNKPELYGLRKMNTDSRLLPDTASTNPPNAPTGQQAQIGVQMAQWHIRRAQQLRDMNRDNSVLEEGSAEVQGSEKIKPGRFLKITRGDLVAEAYVPAISHSISPLDGWTCHVTLERGMGFLTRLKMAGSPFWKEGRKGPYDDA